MAYLQHAEAEAEEYYQEEDEEEEEEEEEEEAEEAEEEEEESEDDLFGPSNEEYMGTPAFSPLPPPNLPPPLRPAGNHGARGNARGVWHAGRSGAYQSGQSFKGGNGPSKYQKGRWTDERFVAEMTLGFNEETLSHNCPPFQEPSEIACYSRTADGSVHYDDRSLRRFRSGVLEDIGADLNDGFETFVEKREDTEGNGFGDLLACLRDKRIHLDNIHFVTYRNNLNKILGTAYNKSEPWEMGVHKRRGTVYLDVHKLPEGPQSDRQRRLCYWGYSFEQLATTADHVPEANRKEAIVDANVEYCALIKTKLGPHRIIMGAEMDCYDIGRDGRRRYIELKTSRKIEHWTVDKFEKEKLLKFWIQSFLAGVPQIVCAFRDDDGRIMRVDVMGTREITQKVKQKNFWQGGVCLAFADRVLCWLYGTVKENEDYVLKFLPGSNRLELLRAECCPTVISKHVEQLC